jgi:Zn-dependent peptidase ImmA (M78 family)
MIEPSATPEQILNTLGITEPSDIDIDAIAYACGAFITREPLSGCEANVIGVNDRAVITVNSTSPVGRQRFSAGHELGHWMRDRGQSAFGCSNRQMHSEWTANNPETRANRFASDLLLPVSMFAPLARGKPVTTETVVTLATAFNMSRTATAMRLVEHGSFPAIVVYFEGGQKNWSVSKWKEVPAYLKLPEFPAPQTVTATMFEEPSLSEDSDDIRADHWFTADRSEKYYIRESCFRTGPDSVVTLLWWKDEQQIIDLNEAEERRAGRRSDGDWER